MKRLIFLFIILLFASSAYAQITRSFMANDQLNILTHSNGSPYPITARSGAGSTCTAATLNTAVTAYSTTAAVLPITSLDGAGAGCTWTLESSVTLNDNTALQVPRGNPISVNSGQTLTLDCNKIIAGKYQIFAGDGTVSCSQPADVPAVWFPQTRAGLAAADTATTGSVIVGGGSWTIDTNLTVTSDLKILESNAAPISVDSGIVLTISGSVHAGLYPLFTGAGTVTIAEGVMYPQWWGAAGDGTTDDTTAIQAACQALETRTTGVLDFSDKTYMIFKDDTTFSNDADGHPTDILCDLISVDGVELRGQGATFTSNATFEVSGERFAVFKFLTSHNITIGNFKTAFTGARTACDALAANQITQCGGVFALFEDLSTNIKVAQVEVDDYSAAFWFDNRQELTGTASGARDIVIDLVKADTTGYALLHRGAGHRIRARVNCDGCGRSAVLQGVLGPSVIHITSKDNIASTDVGMSDDVTSLDLTYVNTETTELGTSRGVNISLPLNDAGDDYFMQNIKVKIHVDLDSGYLDRCFTLGYAVGSSGAADAGSLFHNIDVSGLCRNTSGSATSQKGFTIEFPTSGWTTASNLSNMHFHDITVEGGGTNQFDLEGLIDTAVLSNITADNNLQITGNTTGDVICINCVATEFFNATDDGNDYKVHFIGGDATTGSNFNLTKKNRSYTNTKAANILQNTYSLQSALFQNFVIRVVNTAGTLQHQILQDDVNRNASEYAFQVNNASTTLANTPSVNSGTDFTSGVGIDAGTTSHLVFDTTVAQIVTDLVAVAVVEYHDGGVSLPLVRPFFGNIDVNGATQRRLHLSFTNSSSGAVWTLNTTNLPAGKSVVVRIQTFLR